MAVVTRRGGLGRRISAGLLASFAVLSLAFVSTVVWAIVQERRAEWRVWQARYAAVDGGDEDARGVQQIWLPELDRVDRCTSCHLAIAEPTRADAGQPFRAHPGRWLETHRPDRYGCTACHGGQGEATSFRGAAHGPIPHWPEPMASPELMEARCGTCHQERRPRGTDWLARGRALMADRNCVACHEVPGHDAAEVRSPRLDGLPRKVSPAWLRGWLKRPRAYLPRSRMGDFRLTEREVEALTAFLLLSPPGAPLEAPDWSRADAERGGDIFRRSRCVTCHEVDGRGGTLGPALTHVGAKTSREWLYAWVRDPHRLQPKTLMPRFGLTDDEARDLAAYLSSDLGDAPEGFLGSGAAPAEDLRAEGRSVFERRGCYSCHDLEGFAPLARIGPRLAGIGDRVLEAEPLVARGVAATLPNWLYSKVTAPDSVLDSARMPTFGFAEGDAAAVTVALLSLRARPVPAAYATREAARLPYEPQGEFGALVRRYRCLSCHTIAGSGHRTAGGAPLSTVPLDRIGSQLTRPHLERYIARPWGVRVSLPERMPHMNVAPEEARALAGYLSMVMVDDAIEGEVPRDPVTVERGKALFDRHGCAACHIAGERGGYVGPELNGSGDRLKPGWTVAWLLEPERWKPGTLEPDRGLSRPDAEALAAYVLSLPARKAGGR